MDNKYDIVSVFLELNLDCERLVDELEKINLSSQHPKIENKSSLPDLP